MPHSLIKATRQGLYCPRGEFYIDPWRPVPRAVVSHAHADHARPGHGTYYATPPSIPLLHKRIGASTTCHALKYGQQIDFGPVSVSLHPAGHILGSAQVRVADDKETWVFSGDYKRDYDPTCRAFEPLACDTFITEATFALPVYRWRATSEVAAQVFAWWQDNARAGRTSVLFTYALGKAQRLLAELTAFTSHTAYLHGALKPLTDIYREAGITMLPTEPVSAQGKDARFAGELVLAPPSAAGSTWMRRFRKPSTGFASGWMQIRGNRRRRGYDRGFVISDHADWPGLLRTIRETGAKRVLTTHGRADELVGYLREHGLDAAPLTTPYSGEEDDA